MSRLNKFKRLTPAQSRKLVREMNKNKKAGKTHVRAEKIKAFGKEFDSKGEHEFYAWLLSEKIDFDFQYEIEFYPGVGKDRSVNLLENGALRSIKYTIDFRIKVDRHRHIYVEYKGFHKKSVVKDGVTRKGVNKDGVKTVEKNRSYSSYMQKINLLKHYLYNKKRLGDRVVVVDQRMMPEFRRQLMDVINGDLDIIELKYT